MKGFRLHAKLIIACPLSFFEHQEYLPAQGSLTLLPILLLKSSALMISLCLYSSSISSRRSNLASRLDPPACLVIWYVGRYTLMIMSLVLNFLKLFISTTQILSVAYLVFSTEFCISVQKQILVHNAFICILRYENRNHFCLSIPSKVILFPVMLQCPNDIFGNRIPDYFLPFLH